MLRNGAKLKMATIKICNCCGSELSTYDDFSVNTTAGYGSKHDGLHIAFDLCGDCLDKMLDKMKSEFKISPIVEPVFDMDACRDAFANMDAFAKYVQSSEPSIFIPL